MIAAIHAGVRAGQQLQETAVNIADHDLQKLPRPEMRLHTFCVQSLDMASKKWELREMHVTAKSLCFGQKGSDVQIDSIPLDEIMRVQHIHDQKARTRTERFADAVKQFAGLMPKDQNASFSARRHSSDAPKSPKLNLMDAQSYKLSHKSVPGLTGDDPGLAWSLSDPCLIRTIKDGVNAGRVYRLKANSPADLKHIMQTIQHAVDDRWKQKLGPGMFFLQRRVKYYYDSDTVQCLIATIIVGAFFLSIVSSELENIVPSEDVASVQDTLQKIELVIVIMFTIELAVNAFGNWFWPFIESPWNMFDIFVVFICWSAVALRSVPNMGMLRLLRVFRVLRLIRGLTSLRQIVNALAACIIPVCNAVALFLITTCIYAIIATDLFKDKSPEFFGSFSASAFTMFQCATGDAWASEITRELSEHQAMNKLRIPIAMFFVSFILIVGLVLINVVIACLLDNFIRFMAEEKVEKEKSKREEERALTACPGPLDPVLNQMVPFLSFEELDIQINALWDHIETDGDGSLTCMEMNEGFRHVEIPGGADIYFSTENFLALTDGLLSPDGGLSRENFRTMIIRELHLYMQRQLDHAIPGSDETSMGIMCGIKLLLSCRKFKAASLPESNRDASAGLPGALWSEDVQRAKTGGNASTVAEEARLDALQERMDQLENKMTDKMDMVIKILQGLPDRVAPVRRLHARINGSSPLHRQSDADTRHLSPCKSPAARGPESRSIFFHMNDAV